MKQNLSWYWVKLSAWGGNGARTIDMKNCKVDIYFDVDGKPPHAYVLDVGILTTKGSAQ